MHFLICLAALLISGYGFAQAASSTTGVITSTTAESGNRSDSNVESDAQSFQLSMCYGTGNLSLDINGTRVLAKSGNILSYEDGLPVTGAYTEGTVKQLRTVASTLIPMRGRSLVFGIGLEDLGIGIGGATMNKAGGTEGSLHMNSVIFEAGILKNFSRWGQAMLLTSYDHALGGKLRSRYINKASRSDSEPSYTSISDSIASGSRLSISGNYQISLLPGFSIGLFSSAQYGALRFSERSAASYIYGYTLGLSFMLKI